MDVIVRIWRRLAPARLRAGVGRARARRWALRPVKLGDLRRTTPINLSWGDGRGRSIDRIYIERFLERRRSDIRGRALEAKDDRYVRCFGTAVERVDILDLSPENTNATIVADLQHAPAIPDDSFDCVVLTQVLQYVYDVRAALRTIHRILAPGGVMLATVPGITRISTGESDAYADLWRFTRQSARRLASDVFGADNVEVESYGSVLTAAAFLYGLGSDDLRPEELDKNDPLFEVIVAVRAVKRR